MLISFVRSLGIDCDISEAANGVEAVNLIDSSGPDRFDIIFMDSIMPLMDGPAAVLEIRDRGFKGSIFGITGLASESHAQDFILCGVNEVFTKPFDVNALARAVRTAAFHLLKSDRGASCDI